MKIKLHNSLAKRSGRSDIFIFDDKITLSHRRNCISLTFHICDNYYFLKFFPRTKGFTKEIGFGEIKNESKYKSPWWKDPYHSWKEMSEEDEDQTA